MAHTLYYTPGSGNSFKPALVARQTGRPLRMRQVDVLAGETRGAAFLAVNPRGQVPYLVTDGGVGLGESNAIAWFLAEGSPLMPATALARAQAVQWMIFEQTALEPNISPARFFTHILPGERDRRADDIKRWQEAGHTGLAQLERHLASHAFVAGNAYSVADIAVYGYTHLAGEGGFDLQGYPAMRGWMHRVAAQPGYADVGTLLAPSAGAAEAPAPAAETA
ncbi:MAG: glutathione S-transferase family protein [Rubrivivax sp.]|nr:glutathione S-transferase family protein [Rubrivivax sp.]